MMIISVVNHSAIVKRTELARAVRAVNRQLLEDYAPFWGRVAQLRVESSEGRAGMKALRGDALLVVGERQTAPNLGYHAMNLGIPVAYVFTDLAKVTRLALPWCTWTVELSHEALEMVADAQANTLVKGPHPKFRRTVFHYREICDPVQGTTYEIDNVPVANFVLPHYFNPLASRTGRNDFLGEGVESFRWLAEGYVGFWDPRVGANGRYVVWPDASASAHPSRIRRARGPHSRLKRYAAPVRHVRGG